MDQSTLLPLLSPSSLIINLPFISPLLPHISPVSNTISQWLLFMRPLLGHPMPGIFHRYLLLGGVRRKTSQKRAVEVESLTVEAHASAMCLTRGVIRCKEAQYKEAELVTSKVHIWEKKIFSIRKQSVKLINCYLMVKSTVVACVHASRPYILYLSMLWGFCVSASLY